MKRKYITYDELADFYARKTGGRARTLPLDDIVDWAIKQPEITVDTNELLYFKQWERKQT